MISFQTNETTSVTDIVKLIMLIMWAFGQIFVYCDASERVTIQFDGIDFYSQCDWQEFPLCIRRSIPIVIACTQQSVVLSSIGNVQASRETFKKVSSKLKFRCHSNPELFSIEGGQLWVHILHGASSVFEVSIYAKTSFDVSFSILFLFKFL